MLRIRPCPAGLTIIDLQDEAGTLLESDLPTIGDTAESSGGAEGSSPATSAPIVQGKSVMSFKFLDSIMFYDNISYPVVWIPRMAFPVANGSPVQVLPQYVSTLGTKVDKTELELDWVTQQWTHVTSNLVAAGAAVKDLLYSGNIVTWMQMPT